MGTTADLKITWDADRGLRNYVQGDDLVIDSRLREYYPTITGRVRHGKIGCEDSRNNFYGIQVIEGSTVDLSTPLWSPAVGFVRMRSISIYHDYHDKTDVVLVDIDEFNAAWGVREDVEAQYEEKPWFYVGKQEHRAICEDEVQQKLVPFSEIAKLARIVNEDSIKFCVVLEHHGERVFIYLRKPTRKMLAQIHEERGCNDYSDFR